MAKHEHVCFTDESYINAKNKKCSEKVREMLTKLGDSHDEILYYFFFAIFVSNLWKAKLILSCLKVVGNEKEGGSERCQTFTIFL